MEQNIVSYVVGTESGKQAELTFYDADLIAHTKNLVGFRLAVSKAVIGKCAEYAAMSEDKSYTKAGFKDVADYAGVVFGDKRATVNLYVRVGKYFTVGTGKDVRIVDGLPSELTSGQLLELLPLVTDSGDISKCIEAYSSGALNSRMTTKRTREAVKLLNTVPEAPKAIEQSTSKATDKAPEQSTSKATEQTDEKSTSKATEQATEQEVVSEITLKDIYDLYKSWNAKYRTENPEELKKRAKLEQAFEQMLK